MTRQSAETILTWLLRFFGALTLSAVVAVFLPTAWMVAANDWLGLEPLAPTALTQYLTRSLSAIYALLGALTLYVSRDVRRYSDFIAFAGMLTIPLGVFFTVLGLRSGLPAAWMWSEGPPTVILGAVMIWLARRAHGAEPATSERLAPVVDHGGEESDG